MCFESTHVACRYEQHAARSWASHSSDDEMPPRAEQRSAADCGQPAVCPSPPHLQRVCASDAAFSLLCRTPMTTDVSTSSPHLISQSLNKKDYYFYIKVLAFLFITRPTGYGLSHVVFFGKTDSEERW